MKKEEFVIGNWYKATSVGNFYIKYSYIDGNRLYYTERIDFSVYRKETDWMDGKHTFVHTNISEIAQYLPKGHKDLVKTEQYCIY